MIYETELCHHGVKGMKWGIRKDRSADSKAVTTSANRNKKKGLTDKQKKYAKTGAIVAGAALATYGAYKLAKSGRITEAVARGKSVMKQKKLARYINGAFNLKVSTTPNFKRMTDKQLNKMKVRLDLENSVADAWRKANPVPKSKAAKTAAGIALAATVTGGITNTIGNLDRLDDTLTRSKNKIKKKAER